MKKAYTKPAIYVENFTLSQSVAAGACGTAFGKPAQSDKYTCGWDYAGAIVWLADAGTNCDFTVDAETNWEGVCYNNPNGGSTIFSYS